MPEKPRRLGRGLEALLATSSVAATAKSEVTTSVGIAASPLREIPVAQIQPNPHQPRRNFAPEELAELEASLRASGLLQPITVRERPDTTFELIAGERRLRAATRLGWTTIPAIVKPTDDRNMLVLALVENLQRADLNPLDEAMGYQRLIEDFGLTQQLVADAVGKDRTTVANLLRVLALPEGVRQLLRDGQISLGHARALLGMPNERAILEGARQIIERQLNVRETERLAQALRPAPPPTPARPGDDASSQTVPGARAPRRAETAEVRRLTELLRRRLQTDVHVQLQGDARGEVTIAFYSIDDLHRVVELILGQPLDAT